MATKLAHPFPIIFHGTHKLWSFIHNALQNIDIEKK